MVSVVGGAPVSDSAGMIAMPSPLLTIESTVPSSSAWTVALGIQFAVPRLVSGQLALDETVVRGFDRIVDAFLSMLRVESADQYMARSGYEGRGAHP